MLLPICLTGLLTQWEPLALGICLVAISLVFYFRWNFYTLLLYCAGRGRGCSALLAFRIPNFERITRKECLRLESSARLLEKDPQKLELWETLAGKFWIPKRFTAGDVLFEMLAERALDCYGGQANGVRQGDIVLDCGANVGIFVREALDAGAKLVVASEPSPENLECLNRNFAEEISAGRVVVSPKGLWHEETVLSIGISDASAAGDSFVRAGDSCFHEGPKIPVTTIDSLVASLKLDKVDFVKMDIEGAERNALQGAQDTVKRFRPRMAISAYHLPDDPAVLRGIVSGFCPDMHCTVHLGRLAYGGLLHSRVAPLIFFFN